MYKRTFEILAKYISQETGVTLAFDTEGPAHADMTNKVLHLPKNIGNENAMGAIALAMHEAGHIKHSKIIPIKEIVKTTADFHILNAIEDVRVDINNFGVLPNIRDFYREMVKKYIDFTNCKAPEEARRLCIGILSAESFSPNISVEDERFMATSKLTKEICEGVDHIYAQDWSLLKKRINKIKKILNITPDKEQPYQPQPGEGNGGIQNKNQSQQDCLDGVDQIIHPSEIWQSGTQDMIGPSGNSTNPLAMDEQCANQFKEILNQKEIKIVNEGTILDTDNLTAYFTGDTNELFKEEKVVKKKKSKVMFLLDASGSMEARLTDGKHRYEVVQSSVKKLTQILDEVRELEGIDVDWEIGQFRNGFYPLKKENWESSYSPRGGTQFQGPFIQCVNKLLQDYTITGKKIIIVFTDGDVEDHEIKNVKDYIVKNFSDVRSMLIGVGTDFSSAMAKELVGDNIIIAEENAVNVIMETIKSML
jgi:hypothetical protein